MIITGASRAYAASLLALLGSLRLNWPRHPPVLVYDIGLDEQMRALLDSHHINVRRVPEFCPQWRRHFTWKLWAWNNAPALDVLWIDAGIAVLRPLDAVFEAVRRQGYFVVENGHPLSVEASPAARDACGVTPEWCGGRITLTGGFMGFRRQGAAKALLCEALRLAREEDSIKATGRGHRHDQPLLSLLIYRDLHPVQPADPAAYLRAQSPREVPGQAIWWHRRAVRPADAAHLAAHLTQQSELFAPRPPRVWRNRLPLYMVRRWIGKAIPRVIYDGVRD